MVDAPEKIIVHPRTRTRNVSSKKERQGIYLAIGIVTLAALITLASTGILGAKHIGEKVDMTKGSHLYEQAKTKAGEAWDRTKEKGEETVESVKRSGEHFIDRAKDTLTEGHEKVKEILSEGREKVRDSFEPTLAEEGILLYERAKTKAGEAWDRTKEKGEETVESVKRSGEHFIDRAKDTLTEGVEKMKRKSRDAADSGREKVKETYYKHTAEPTYGEKVKEKLSEGHEKVKEVGEHVGEKLCSVCQSASDAICSATGKPCCGRDSRYETKVEELLSHAKELNFPREKLREIEDILEAPARRHHVH